MPEGDTIHAVARVMAPDVVGQALVGLTLDKLPRPIATKALVTACRAVGKHLLIELATVGDGAMILRVHLGMKGSWHRYRPGEAWQRPAIGARVELATERWVFVCFGPKDVDLIGRNAPRPNPVAHLGPDLLGPSLDGDLTAEVVAHARRPDRAAMTLGELLMTQTVAAGIGNVYKSEVLFLERLNPWTTLGAVSDDDLRRLYLRARALMRQNLDDGGWRITTRRARTGERVARGERHWVYRRAGLPCRVCATLVESRLQGDQARRTYWCPTCQAPATGQGA